MDDRTHTLEAVRRSVNGRTWRRWSTIRVLADAQFLLILSFWSQEYFTVSVILQYDLA